jgi:hypothetical protein
MILKHVFYKKNLIHRIVPIGERKIFQFFYFKKNLKKQQTLKHYT